MTATHPEYMPPLQSTKQLRTRCMEESGSRASSGTGMVAPPKRFR